jgi:hypothetical protein
MEFDFSDSYVITKKFSSKDEFCLYLHERVKNTKIGYMDTIIAYCQEEIIDIESIPLLIDDSIKSKIREEAEKENMLEPISRLELDGY